MPINDVNEIDSNHCDPNPPAETTKASDVLTPLLTVVTDDVSEIIVESMSQPSMEHRI